MFEPVHVLARKVVKEETEHVYFLLLKDYCKNTLNVKLRSIELNYTTKQQTLVLENPDGTQFSKTLKELFKKELSTCALQP
jgi:hypothetical protein